MFSFEVVKKLVFLRQREKTIKIKKLVFVSIMHWICTIETELLLFFVSEIVRSAATRVTNTLTEN